MLGRSALLIEHIVMFRMGSSILLVNCGLYRIRFCLPILVNRFVPHECDEFFSCSTRVTTHFRSLCQGCIAGRGNQSESPILGKVAESPPGREPEWKSEGVFLEEPM